MTQHSNRIVVLTDMTHLSDSAVATGLSLAQRSGLVPHFLHVKEFVAEPYFSAIDPVRNKAIETFQLELGERAAALGVDFHWVTTDGKPFAETLQYAKDLDAAYVIAAVDAYKTKGKLNTSFGRTSHRLARKADRPIVITHTDTARYKSALLMTDFSDLSLAGAQALLPLVADDAEIHVLTCFELPSFALSSDMLSVPEINYRELELNARRSTEEKLDQFIDSLDLAGRNIHKHIELGIPTEHAIDLIKEKQIAVAGIGTHGRNPMMSVLLGSVAEGLVELAPCDLVIAPPPGREFKNH